MGSPLSPSQNGTEQWIIASNANLPLPLRRGGRILCAYRVTGFDAVTRILHEIPPRPLAANLYSTRQA